MTYQWDSHKARSNLKKHWVQIADAVAVFEDETAITIDDEHPDEDRFITIGTDLLGQILVAVYTWRGENIHIIFAWRAAPNERKAYKTPENEYDFTKGKRGAVAPISPGRYPAAHRSWSVNCHKIMGLW